MYETSFLDKFPRVIYNNVCAIIYQSFFVKLFTSVHKKNFFTQKEADNADIKHCQLLLCKKQKQLVKKNVQCARGILYQLKLAEACLVYTQSLFKHLSHYTDRYQYQCLCSWKLVQYHLSHPTTNRVDHFHS